MTLRDHVWAGIVAGVTSAVAGCGDSASTPDTPNAADADQQGDSPAPTLPALETRQLCNGTGDVRFVFGSGGGMVQAFYPFYAPFGDRFLVVDGECNYVAGITGELGDIREGHLDAEQAREIEANVSYSELDGSYEQYCVDGPVTFMSTPWATALCQDCGCHGDAPQAVARASSAGFDLLQALFDAGTPVATGLRILLVEEPTVEPTAPGGPSPWTWPLTWDPEPLFFSYTDRRLPIESNAGQPVDDAIERTNLRALREQWRTSTLSGLDHVRMQYGDPSGTTTFRLYMRDELSPAVAAALDAVWKW